MVINGGRTAPLTRSSTTPIVGSQLRERIPYPPKRPWRSGARRSSSEDPRRANPLGEIYEDAKDAGVQDIYPLTPVGHCLVATKAHAATIYDRRGGTTSRRHGYGEEGGAAH